MTRTDIAGSQQWTAVSLLLEFVIFLNGSFCNLCALAHKAGVTYLRYTALTSSNNSETAVHCCDPASSVLVLLVSRNVFHVVSALQSIVFIQYFLADQVSCRSYLAAPIVCSPLQLFSLTNTSTTTVTTCLQVLQLLQGQDFTA